MIGLWHILHLNINVRLGVITHIHFIASYAWGFLLPTIPTVKKSPLESIVLLLQGVNSSMKPVDRALVTSSAKTKMMVTIVIQTGSVPVAGVVDVVVVLVKDADDPEVEEEEEGHGDVERWPQVNSDPQELVFIEELP